MPPNDRRCPLPEHGERTETRRVRQRTQKCKEDVLCLAR